MLTALVLDLSSSTPLASPWGIKSNHDSCCAPYLDLLHYKYLQSIENKKAMYFRTLQVWKKKSSIQFNPNCMNSVNIFYFTLDVVDCQCYPVLRPWTDLKKLPALTLVLSYRAWLSKSMRRSARANLLRSLSNCCRKVGNKSFLIWNAPTHWIETMLLPMCVFFHSIHL